MRHLDMTTSDASVDYSGGFTLTASKLGFRSIFAVISAESRSSAATPVPRSLVWVLEAVAGTSTGKLRAFKTLGGVTPTEAVADTDIIDGDIIRLVVLGV